MSDVRRDYNGPSFGGQFHALAQRLSDEGVIDEALAFYRERWDYHFSQHGVNKKQSRARAVQDVMNRWPPPNAEIIDVDNPSSANPLLVREHRHVAEKKAEEDRRDNRLSHIVADLPEYELEGLDDLQNWVLNNLHHTVVDPHSPSKWTIRAKDCPSRAHFSMLRSAALSSQKFIEGIQRSLLESKRSRESHRQAIEMHRVRQGEYLEGEDSDNPEFYKDRSLPELRRILKGFLDEQKEKQSDETKPVATKRKRRRRKVSTPAAGGETGVVEGNLGENSDE